MSKDRPRKILNQLFVMAQDVPPVSKSRIMAALYLRNNIIAYGSNEAKTHPMAARYAKHPEATSLHAEISCIRNALKRIDLNTLAKCTLYVARAKKLITGDFVWGMAKPCSGCSDAIITFNIPKVIYTMDDYHIGSYSNKNGVFCDFH